MNDDGRTSGGPFDRAFALLGRADRAIAAAHRDLADDDHQSAAEHACEAMLFIASACLDRDGVAPTRPADICAAYGPRFGRSGRLYSAYHRWLFDAVDLRRAVDAGIRRERIADAAQAATERAELFRDAASRFVERT